MNHRILHFADVHLGMTNLGIHRTSDLYHPRIMDYLDAFDNMIAQVADMGIDLCIFSGDAFKTRVPSPTLIKLFSERIQRLAAYAPVLIVVGNHDKQKDGTGKCHATTILGELIGVHDIIVADELAFYDIAGIQIVALPWIYDVDIDNVVAAILEYASDADDDRPLVLAGHCAVEGAVLHGNYSHYIGESDDIYPLDVFAPFDYVALGHIHKHQELPGMSHVVYSGSLERVNWGEMDDKGFVVADVVVGGVAWEFHSIDPRPLLDVVVGYDNISTLREFDTQDAVVRVAVHCKHGGHDSSSVARKAHRLLHASYLIDAVNVVQPRDERYENVGLMNRDHPPTPLDLVGEWVDNVYGDDPERADRVYFAAKDLIAMVDDRQV